MSPDKLHVIFAISNPERFKSRVDLCKVAGQRVLDAGANLWIGEAAFGDRAHEVTDSTNPRHIQFRTKHELWHKENIINRVIERLPASAEYVAWVDADVLFTRPDWAAETVHQLQHFQFVQMWSHCQDLGPKYTIVKDENGSTHLPSMFYQHVNGGSPNWSDKQVAYGRHPGHCGYAWAARREALDKVGGLIDFSICGANDHHMGRGLLGDISASVHGKSSPELKQRLQDWQDRAERHVRRNVGVCDGLLLHHWHGKKSKRGYRSRWQILVDGQFNPNRDIKVDSQGLYQLNDDGSDRMRNMRDDLIAYFRARSEDSIDE